MTTLACPFESDAQRDDPNSVKVILSATGGALYFSRAAIPYFRNPVWAPVYHHVGLYGFYREFLDAYAELEPTPLERCEALEQLRVLEHGYHIQVELVDEPTLEINTPDDYARAVELLAEGALDR